MPPPDRNKPRLGGPKTPASRRALSLGQDAKTKIAKVEQSLGILQEMPTPTGCGSKPEAQNTNRFRIRTNLTLVAAQVAKDSLDTYRRFVKPGDDQQLDAIAATIDDKLSEARLLVDGVVQLLVDGVAAKRQEVQTPFENFDQKANQLFNILSTVLKNMKEMEGGIVRSIA